MKKISKIEFKLGTLEEQLPGFSDAFQHISSYVELDKYPQRSAPWHWHKALELFYIKRGSLEYITPNANHTLYAGYGGLINSNTLHMTRLLPDTTDNIQLIHLFDSSFLSGETGNLIDSKYVAPFVNDLSTEMLIFSPEISEHRELLDLLENSFSLTEDAFGYEIKLHQILTELWLKILELKNKQTPISSIAPKSSSLMKQLMMFVHEHYTEKICVSDLAAAAFISERECYRLFQECLKTTPAEYIRNYRLQAACQYLINTKLSIVEIGHLCGLGSSSYFGQQFKEHTGLTPSQYRSKMAES